MLPDSAAPAPVHYIAAKHIMCYLYATFNNGTYFWRTPPRMDLPDLPLPPISSNTTELLTSRCPKHHTLEAHGYVDPEWANCLHA